MPTNPSAPWSLRVMPLKVNLAHHALDAFGGVIDLGHVFPQDPAGYVLREGGAGCCLANPWPRSSMSIRGWSTWLMSMRLAMECRRRSSVGEGVGGMGDPGWDSLCGPACWGGV